MENTSTCYPHSWLVSSDAILLSDLLSAGSYFVPS